MFVKNGRLQGFYQTKVSKHPIKVIKIGAIDAEKDRGKFSGEYVVSFVGLTCGICACNIVLVFRFVSLVR